MKTLFAAFVLQPLQDAQLDQREYLLSDSSRQVDWETILVLLGTALALTFQYYAFITGNSFRLWGEISRENVELARRVWWAIGQMLVYVGTPCLVVLAVPGRSLRDYGAKFRGAFSCWWAYLLMYLVMVPFIFLASYNERFLHTYPFYKLASGELWWPRLYVWELFYAGQFFALEFFFRGFVLHGTRRRFGAYAILVMTVPYCMIHFGKPWPETLGSIVAGLVLGFMSLKTRSIWMGAALHIAVAWTMDTAALWQKFSGNY